MGRRLTRASFCYTTTIDARKWREQSCPATQRMIRNMISLNYVLIS